MLQIKGDKMRRELVSKDDLISILNKKLAKYEECENCRFVGLLDLAEEDEDGCNWSRTSVTVRCSGVPADICEPFAARIVSEVGKKYNIRKQ
jgi:hypothetical protein